MSSFALTQVSRVSKNESYARISLDGSNRGALNAKSKTYSYKWVNFWFHISQLYVLLFVIIGQGDIKRDKWR